MKMHEGRAHSKFSASGAERWLNCSMSVELSEGMPDKDSPASLRGTLAHKVLERIMRLLLKGRRPRLALFETWKGVDSAMYKDALNAANFIFSVARKADVDVKTQVLVETRVYLTKIHEEMFGTFDGAILDYFAVLHIFDFKYGTHLVSPRKNVQMLFYALGMAYQYDWNFESVRLWIVQPRARGYDGPTFWDISIEELREFEQVFIDGVWRVENEPTLKTGEWCFFCKAQKKCPAKLAKRREKTVDAFGAVPVTQSKKEVKTNGKEEKIGKDQKGRKEVQEQKRLIKKGWQKVKG